MGGITDVHVTSVIKRTGLINMYSILVVIEDKLTAVIEDGVVINFQHTCVIAATATTEAPGSFVIDRASPVNAEPLSTLPSCKLLKMPLV